MVISRLEKVLLLYTSVFFPMKNRITIQDLKTKICVLPQTKRSIQTSVNQRQTHIKRHLVVVQRTVVPLLYIPNAVA